MRWDEGIYFYFAADAYRRNSITVTLPIDTSSRRAMVRDEQIGSMRALAPARHGVYTHVI